MVLFLYYFNILLQKLVKSKKHLFFD